MVRCDGFGPDGYFDYNGIDDDTLFLARTNWSRDDVDIVDKFIVPGLKDLHFNYNMGEFEFRTNDKQLRVILGQRFMVLEAQNPQPLRDVQLPEEYTYYELEQMTDTNYYLWSDIYDDRDSSYPGWIIYRWFINGDSVVGNKFNILRQEEIMNRRNLPGLTYRLYKVNEDFIYYGKEKAPNFDPSRESTVELVKARHNGEVIWRRTFFDAELPGSIEGLLEINDTLICTGLVYHYHYRSGMGERKKYPFLRMMTKDGEYIHQPKPEAEPIYPNPFEVDFYLNLPNLRKLYLYDFNGKLVGEKAFHSEFYLNRIEWPDLEGGLYLLVAEDKFGRRFEYKISKSRR